MDQTTLALLPLITVLVLMCMGFAAIGWYDRKHSANPVYDPSKLGKYDERQLADQANAMRYAFWTTCGYLLVWAGLETFHVSLWETVFGALLGVTLGGGVFGVTCILRDAYFRPKNTARTTMLPIFAAQLGTWLGRGDAPLLSGGRLSNGALFLLPCLLSLALSAALVARFVMERGDKKKHMLVKRDLFTIIFAAALGLGSVWNWLCLTDVLPQRLWWLSLAGTALISMIVIITTKRRTLRKKQTEKSKSAASYYIEGLLVCAAAAYAVTVLASMILSS